MLVYSEEHATYSYSFVSHSISHESNFYNWQRMAESQNSLQKFTTKISMTKVLHFNKQLINRDGSIEKKTTQYPKATIRVTNRN
jgi:hypothetical protein